MRRVLSFLICLAMLASLCACGRQPTPEEEVRKKAEEIVDSALQDTFGTPDQDDDANKDEKGTFENPYQLGDGFEATLQSRTGKGSVKILVSNVQVGEPEPEYQNHVPITFDLEILESDVSDPVDFSFDLSLDLSYLDSNGLAWGVWGGYVYDDDVIGQLFPDDYSMFLDRCYMPQVGAKWSFAILAAVEEGHAMDYLMFHYYANRKDTNLYFEL